MQLFYVEFSTSKLENTFLRVALFCQSIKTIKQKVFKALKSPQKKETHNKEKLKSLLMHSRCVKT